MYRSSSPGLAGKKWQKTSSMSSKMIVVFPVPPAPIKRHACCVRFRKGVWFSSSCNATSIASANHLQANHSSWHIFEHVSDILTQTFSLNFFQTYQYLLTFLTYFWPFFLTHSFWTSCKHIFWHSIWLILWHLATTSLTHSFCNYYQSFPSQLRSGTPHWTRMIAVGVRHATLNSQDRSWGPAHNTELTTSQLGSGTPHWTRRIAVGVRHATLNSQDRGWGPARHTELTISRQEEEEGGGKREEEAGGGEGEETNIKSNNPHLTGGEQSRGPSVMGLFFGSIQNGRFEPNHKSSWWLNQPIWKIRVKLDHFPR